MLVFVVGKGIGPWPDAFEGELELPGRAVVERTMRTLAILLHAPGCQSTPDIVDGPGPAGVQAVVTPSAVLQPIFRITPFSASPCRTNSATGSFNRRSSSSSNFNRCASFTSAPPYSAFQPWNVAALIQAHDTGPPSSSQPQLLQNPADLLFRIPALLHRQLPPSDYEKTLDATGRDFGGQVILTLHLQGCSFRVALTAFQLWYLRVAEMADAWSTPCAWRRHDYKLEAGFFAILRRVLQSGFPEARAEIRAALQSLGLVP